MEKENRLDCLTELQRQAYTLWQSGMAKTNVAKKMGISYKGAIRHIKNAERRLLQYDKAQETRERNKQPIELPLSRADGLILYEALRDYIVVLESTANNNVKSDWIGDAPYQLRIAADLFDRVQFAVFGRKVVSTLLDWETMQTVSEEVKEKEDKE